MTTSMENGSEVQTTSNQNQDILPSHLGGHLNKTHNDRGALQYLMNTFNIKSFLDIGCGPGGMVELAQLRGLRAVGIDGDWQVEKCRDTNIIIHDFNEGPLPIRLGDFDLGWSVEFLEHVEEKYQDFYMDSFKLCRYVVITAAPPGWAGHHHVNCQSSAYWIEVFDKHGFDYREDITQQIKQHSTMQKGFINLTGLFFERRDTI
mgnify:FL=1